MKIAIVVPGGLHPSGQEQVVRSWLALFERLAVSHQIHAFVLKHLPAPQSYSLRGFSVHDLGRPSAALGLTRWAQERALSRALDHHGPFDLIHGFYADPAGRLAGRAGRFAPSELRRGRLSLSLVMEKLLSLGIAPLAERWRARLYGWYLRRKAATWQSREQVRLEADCLKLHTTSHRTATLNRYEAAVTTALRLPATKRSRPDGFPRVLTFLKLFLPPASAIRKVVRPVPPGQLPLDRTPSPNVFRGNRRKIARPWASSPARHLLNDWPGVQSKNGVQQAGLCGVVGGVPGGGSRRLVPGRPPEPVRHCE